ncbi:MAG: MBL fold metallo-hydrolase [Clostridiales bacterium]|nr:MBL fold metallo-hydrolase [Clostridiales bacterium]
MKIKRFIGGNLESNGYIISEENRCYIIDPGYNPGRFIKEVREKDLEPLGIILTHHHYDHSGAADAVASELECPVLLHRRDGDIYRGRVDRFLEDGDVLELGTGAASRRLEIINTPGHTHGSICIMDEKDRLCFTGDTVFNVDLGRTDLEDGSESEMRDSICNIVDSWPNDIMLYPGHGDLANMKKVRRINREFTEMTETKVK